MMNSKIGKLIVFLLAAAALLLLPILLQSTGSNSWVRILDIALLLGKVRKAFLFVRHVLLRQQRLATLHHVFVVRTCVFREVRLDYLRLLHLLAATTLTRRSSSTRSQACSN